MKPLNIAHRGGADLWPENTLEAFARAIETGADGIEFDLQLTADGHLVVHHDTRLKPDATRKNGVYLRKPTPKISQLTRAELADYDVGRLDPDSPYGKRRSKQSPLDGARIPDFGELCALVRDKALKTSSDFRLYAELKTEMDDDAAAVARLAQAFISDLKQSGLVQQTHVISFDWRAVTQVRAALPNIAHAYTTLPFATTDPSHISAAHDTPNSEEARARAASAAGARWWGGHDWRDFEGATHGEKILRAIAASTGRGWFAYWRDITPQNMALAQELGLSVSAWTVNETNEMQALKAQAIAAIVTDRPDRMFAL